MLMSKEEEKVLTDFMQRSAETSLCYTSSCENRVSKFAQGKQVVIGSLLICSGYMPPISQWQLPNKQMLVFMAHEVF